DEWCREVWVAALPRRLAQERWRHAWRVNIWQREVPAGARCSWPASQNRRREVALRARERASVSYGCRTSRTRRERLESRMPDALYPVVDAGLRYLPLQRHRTGQRELLEP